MGIVSETVEQVMPAWPQDETTGLLSERTGLQSEPEGGDSQVFSQFEKRAST